MYWSTEDHHRHHQPNYYNNYQVAQHQNGVQQATAAVPPPQQHQQTHPTPPPPPQQQQPHQHPQQLHPNQQQHLSHRTVQQQMPGHYQANQHYQQHPQHQQQQQQQQLHHHQQQWVPRPSSILTAPPRLYQQFSATMPSSAQYCTAPPQFYHAPPRVTQPTAVAAPSQQRPSLPPTYGFYPIQQQAAVAAAAAAALRQNVIAQAPTNIMTPPTTTSAQPIQIQYFPTPAYCQPPAFGPVVPSAIPETPPVVKQRKHAIPIIDPDTKENVLEREFRRSESESPADVRSIGATSSSTSVDLKGLDEEPCYIPQTVDIDLTDQDKSEEIEETIDQEEDITDSSAQLPPPVVDHVESIEAKQEVEEDEEEEEVVETTTQLINIDDDGPVEVQCINASPTNENQVESNGTDNNDDHKQTQSTVEENLPPTIEHTECPTTALKVDKQHQTPTQQQEQLPPLPPPMEIEENTIQSPKTASKVGSKQQQTAKPQPPQSAAVKKLPPPKKGKKNKRLKDSQRKQKADLLNTESNNNNTTKITNQNQKPIEPEPHNSTKSNIQTESVTGVDGADEAAKSCPAAMLDDHERSDESSEKVDDVTENSNTMDDNDQSSQIYDSPKLTKSEQIASEILGIESTDDNSVLFLNSSVSGLEDDLCPSPLDDTLENDKARDIRFGDFPEENLTQDKQQDVVEDKKYTYTLETLKSLAGEPASQIAPALKNDHCGKIGKYSGSAPAVASYQQNHMYQQMSYKDSINCLNRRRVKRNDTPSHQQFQQQYDYQQQQQQQQQQRKPDIIRINLSLNEEIQLAKSENAWMPAGLQISAPKSESDEDEKILKKVRGILNKLTPENFDKLLQSASSFPINGPDRMKKVMLLIFEKTISEPNFAPTYACFCKFLFNAKNQNHEAFNKILIKRINDEFESNVNNAKAKNAKLRPIMDKLAAATDPKEVAEIKTEIDDQEYKFRRRAWGTVRFIGEMFKLGFISTEKVCACVEELFDPKCEEKLEYMCKLLTTVGAQLEPVNKHQTSADKSISNRLSELFTKIRQLVERKKLSGIKISSRVRFMLQDMCDLRRRSWDQKISATPPPAMRSREASPAITKVAHQSQQRDRGPPPRTANNYIQSSGAYDKRRQQTAGDEQKKSAQNKIDINKLMPMFNNVDTTRPLGNSSLTKWHHRGQPSGIIQPNSRPPLSSSECKCLLSDLVEVVIDDEPKTKWIAEWKQIPSDQHPTLIYYLFAEYLLSAKVQRVEINACTRLFISLIREDLLTHAAFNEGYQKFSADSHDILLDVPKGWQYVFDFLGPLLHLELIPFSMIWCPKWFDSPDGEKFLHSMIRHFTSEFGANYMRYFWQAFLQWETFMTEDRAQSFIANNRFEFIENEKCRPPVLVQRSVDEQVQRIKELLSESGRNVVDLVIDFLSTNVHIDCSFIRKLTSYICDYIVIYNNTPNSSSLSSNSNKKSKLSNSSKNAAATLRKGELRTMCIPIFRRCIDSKDEHELSCLDAIVKRCKDLYGSSADNLIREILTELDGVVISKESFEKWYQQQLSHDDNILTNDLNEFFQSRHDCD